LISLLVAGFIFYLYAPHLLFKFAAATNYDLITRKEIPQVEEFFAAGLPGIFLNLQAVLLVRFVLPLFGIARITPDWQTIALIFEKEPDLSPYVRGPFITSLLAYAAMLGVSSSLAGWQYGRSLRLIALAGGTKKYVQQLFANVSIPQAVALPVRVLALWYSRFWNTFYAQYRDPFYPVVLRRSLRSSTRCAASTTASCLPPKRNVMVISKASF
jgi:hypothetical protein